MANAKKNTELAPVENFALTTAYDGLDPELVAELKDQMDDLDDESGINCRTIKIPSGGNLAFTVQGDEDGDRPGPSHGRGGPRGERHDEQDHGDGRDHHLSVDAVDDEAQDLGEVGAALLHGGLVHAVGD